MASSGLEKRVLSMSFDAHKQQAVAKVRFYTPFEVSVRVKHDAPRRSV
jgi:hypothetical protein